MQQVLNKLVILGSSLLGLFGAGIASAQVCPVCVVAIGAGLGLSRWFGIDDILTSIWIGAFLIVINLGTLVLMKRKNWIFPDYEVVVTLAYILLTYIPLYYAGIIGHPLNKAWGIDKIILGSVVGTIAFFIGHWINLYLKKINNGKAFFPYQKVVVPLGFLILTTIIFQILINYRFI